LHAYQHGGTASNRRSSGYAKKALFTIKI